MRQIPANKMTVLHTGGTTQSSSPIYYDFNGVTGGDPNVDVWPVPNAAYTLNFDMVIPQEDLSADADVLTVPHWPVVLGAIAKAMAERGEDGGFMFAEAESNYQKALSDSIALDAANLPFETIWNVV